MSASSRPPPPSNAALTQNVQGSSIPPNRKGHEVTSHPNQDRSVQEILEDLQDQGLVYSFLCDDGKTRWALTQLGREEQARRKSADFEAMH